jgi:hypothetical protein
MLNTLLVSEDPEQHQRVAALIRGVARGARDAFRTEMAREARWLEEEPRELPF